MRDEIKFDECINVSMMLDKDKEQFQAKNNIYELEQGDIIKCNLNLHEVTRSYKIVKSLIILSTWSKSISLIENRVYCNGEIIEYKPGESLIVPNKIVSNKTVITFYFKAESDCDIGCELQFGVNYTFFDKNKGENDNIRFYSPKIYLNFMICKVKVIIKEISKETPYTNHYEAYIENTGDIQVKDVRCKFNLLDGARYITKGLYINDEKPLHPGNENYINLYNISPGEKIKLNFDIDIKDVNLNIEDKNKGIYLEVFYEYTKQKKVKKMVRSNEIKIGSKKRCNGYICNNKQCNDFIVNQTVKTYHSCDRSIFDFEIDIVKNQDVYIRECNIMYILYYKLNIIPGSIKMNGSVIKGDVTNLKLHSLEKEKGAVRVKINFKADVRSAFIRDYILNTRYCSKSRMRIRYIDENYKNKVTPTNCVVAYG